MTILSMVQLMTDLMVKDALMKVDFICSGFGAPSGCNHDGLIWRSNLLVNVDSMVDLRYVDGENVDYCRMVVYYTC